MLKAAGLNGELIASTKFPVLLFEFLDPKILGISQFVPISAANVGIIFRNKSYSKH